MGRPPRGPEGIGGVNARGSASGKDRPAEAASAEAKVSHLLDVLEVSRKLGATVELQPLLETIERAALKVLDCERATVFLYDRANDELHSRVATGVGEIRFSAQRGIAGEVVRTGAVINVPDAYADARFNPEIDRQTGFKTRNLLTFPLIGYDNSTVGVLQVLNKRGGQFGAWDEELVHSFGAQAGVAIQRQLLLEQYAEKQRIERDLSIARGIQQALLPSEPPKAEGFDIAGWNRPADETGGDCYDFFALPDGKILITIADATGHGIGPALVIAECRALLRATLSLTRDLDQAVSIVNNLLCDDLPDNRFVTAFLGLLEPRAGALQCTSAGHGPLIFFTAAKDEFRELAANGLPLGIMDGVDYEKASTLTFAPGDMLLLFTDGFIEWANAEGEQYGTERIYALIRENRSRPAAELIEMVYRSVLAFADGTTQKDDLTAVLIRKL